MYAYYYYQKVVSSKCAYLPTNPVQIWRIRRQHENGTIRTTEQDWDWSKRDHFTQQLQLEDQIKLTNEKHIPFSGCCDQVNGVAMAIEFSHVSDLLHIIFLQTNALGAAVNTKDLALPPGKVQCSKH